MICILAHPPIINSKSKEIILGVRTTWEINFNLSSATTSQFLAPLPFQMYMPDSTSILQLHIIFYKESLSSWENTVICNLYVILI